MGIAVRILLLRAVELEVWCEPQMTTDGLHTSGFCAAIFDFWQVRVPPMSIAFRSQSIFRNVTKAHCVIYGGSRVMVTRVSWGYFNPPPLVMRGLTQTQIHAYHLMAGFGRPLAAASKRTFCPSLTSLSVGVRVNVGCSTFSVYMQY